MTDLAPPTTLGGQWRRWRRAVAVVAAMIAVAVAVGLVQSQQSRGYLDPAGVDPTGSRAVVRLLEDRGVDVTPARTTDDALTAAGNGAGTILVTTPDLLGAEQIDRLLGSGAELVLVAPDTTVGTYRPGLERAATGNDLVLDAACSLPEAERAGAARMGGLGYDGRDAATTCYPHDDAATLVVDTTEQGDRVVVIGSGALLTNEHLDDDGNAALAMNLLGSTDTLTWYRPVPELEGTASFTELMPGWVQPVAWQLGIAAVLAALWRARRMGPLVTEALPVVVRSTETTEGRARLYRRGRSRAHAARTLRSGTAQRLRLRLGVPLSAPEPALVDAVATRTGRPAAEVAATIAGPDPDDDVALVRLSDTLTALEKEVRTP